MTSVRTGAAKRVLILSYPFPPVGGAGVQRAVKFVKYLGDWGWEASVLTVANPSVPALDDSLLRDVPPAAVIRRARTWEPGYRVKSAVASANGQGGPRPGRGLIRGLIRRASNLVLQPDPQILWVPHAIREGLRLLRELRHDALVATGPPFSTFLAAASLRRKTGLPLILDYRDEWDLSNAYLENRRPDPVSRWLQGRMQARVVRAASALVATTSASASALERVRDRAGSSASVSWIYNGFDPDDFADRQGDQPRDPGVFRLAYVGTLWKLTDCSALVEAIRRLAAAHPDLAARLELVCAGRRTPEQDGLLERLRQTPCRLALHPYVPHGEVTDLLRSADGLCALLADLPGAHRVVPAKIFEYIASRRFVLTVAPRGELWDLLRDYPAARCHEPRDVDGIAASLAEALRRHADGSAPAAASWDGSRFDRRNQAGQLATLLDAVTAAN